LTEDFVNRSLRGQELQEINLLLDLLGLPLVPEGGTLAGALAGDITDARQRTDNAVNQLVYALDTFFKGIGI